MFTTVKLFSKMMHAKNTLYSQLSNYHLSDVIFLSISSFNSDIHHLVIANNIRGLINKLRLLPCEFSWVGSCSFKIVDSGSLELSFELKCLETPYVHNFFFFFYIYIYIFWKLLIYQFINKKERDVEKISILYGINIANPPSQISFKKCFSFPYLIFYNSQTSIISHKDSSIQCLSVTRGKKKN